MKVTIEIKDNIGILRCLYKEHIEERKAEVKVQSTKNKTTICALSAAVELLIKPSHLILVIDNKFVRGVIENNWLQNWNKNNWKTAKGTQVANTSEWRYLLELLSRHKYEVI